jgi:hypothetical protein
MRQIHKTAILVEGDLLAPLRRIRARYMKKVALLSALGVRPEKDGMYYETAAANIDRLRIPEDVPV